MSQNVAFLVKGVRFDTQGYQSFVCPAPVLDVRNELCGFLKKNRKDTTRKRIKDACMSGLLGSDHSLDTIQDIKRRNAFRLVYYKNTIHSGYTQKS
jgi:hypothetical protein